MEKGIVSEYRCLRCSGVHQGKAFASPQPAVSEIMSSIVDSMNGVMRASVLGGREPDTFETHLLHKCADGGFGISHLIGATPT